MFWIKLSKVDPNKKYLYLRETLYVRDKRTLLRKPKKLSVSNKADKRYVYTKKKDIYCGKIYKQELKYFLSFKDYILKQYKVQDFLKYSIEITFENLIDDFVKFLLYIYEIDYNLFTNKKKVYQISTGFVSTDTILYLKRFKVNENKTHNVEFERFYNRCLDVGIFDKQIIFILFSKLNPELEIEKDEILNIKEEIYDNLEDFFRKNNFE